MTKYFYAALNLLKARGLVQGSKTILKEFFRIVRRRDPVFADNKPPLVTEKFQWMFQSDRERKVESQEPFDLLVMCPPPGEGSGGHRTLFRFLDLLADKDLKVAITFSNSLSAKNPGLDEHFQNRIYEWFGSETPVVSGPEVWDQARCLMATSWNTAYELRPFEKTHALYYFIQDLEYMFYEEGFYREQADRTYDFGFRAITAGPWIRDALRGRNTRVLADFHFGATPHSSCLGKSKTAGFPKSRIFLYLRPSTARRGMETSLIALEKLYQMRKDFVVITAGTKHVHLLNSFATLNKGILPETELNETICSCDVGLVLSYTNKSLMPDEILSHGLTLVTNAGAQAVWGLPTERVFTGSGTDELAQALSKAIDHARLGVMNQTPPVSWEQAMTDSVLAVVRDISTPGGEVTPNA